MRELEKNFTTDFSSFEQMEGQPAVRGMNDWAVPWSDLMMVMFVLFVVLFIYSTSHKDVKILFSEQAKGEAMATSTLDPLIGLIGQISSRVDNNGAQDFVRMASNQVVYRSRADGVSVVREGSKRVRITLRGDLFFGAGQEVLKLNSKQYLEEIAELIRLSVGNVHVIGYASEDESVGAESFGLSSKRAAEVADLLITKFTVDPKRISVTGRGAFSPELPGTSDHNQAMNRRVEIIITNEI